MVRAKARFNRPPDLTEVDDLSSVNRTLERLKVALRRYFPGHDKEELAVEVFGHPADDFVEVLIAYAVLPALSLLHWNDEMLTKEDLRQELTAVSNKARATARFIRKYPGKVAGAVQVEDLLKMLKTTSRDVDLALDLDVVARNYADSIAGAVSEHRLSDCARLIDELLEHFDKAIGAIRTPKRSEFSNSSIAEELATQVIRVLEVYELCTSSSVACESNRGISSDSPVVSCLVDIGAAIGIRRSKKTWSTYVQKAVRKGARLQHPKR